MGLKKYIGFSLVLIIIVGLYVFSIESGDYEVKFLQYSLTLPTVTWFLIPIVLLFIFTVLHLIFYGSLNYCKNRGFLKDEVTIIETIKNTLLQKKDNSKYKTPAYKNIAGILTQINMEVDVDSFISKDENLNLIVSQIKDIKNGVYVNDKSLRLDTNSPLAKQNLINKMNIQADYSLDILKKTNQFSQDIIKIAFLNVLENKAMTTIKKVYSEINLDREMAYRLFLKDVENTEFGLDKEEILKITKSLNYSQKEYLNLAKMYKEVLSPDKVLELFEVISENNDQATSAYFYILCELEMIEKLRDILTGYNEDEMLPFRALLDLKEAGKHYSLADISI